MYDYATLEKKLKEVISHVGARIKPQEIDEINELIEQHGEYGVAYDLLCHRIGEDQIPITPAIYQIMVDLAEQMKLPPSVCSNLASLQQDEEIQD